jgi:hypothetical protein
MSMLFINPIYEDNLSREKMNIHTILLKRSLRDVFFFFYSITLSKNTKSR